MHYCSVRAYIYHSSIAAVHHSFVLQAIHRFWKIKGSEVLKNKRRKVGFILTQWMFDFVFDLPPTSDRKYGQIKVRKSLFRQPYSKIHLFVYMAVLAYFLPDILINVIHKLLIRHVRQVSSKITSNQERRMRRDLVVVRRIVLLTSPMALVGMPGISHGLF